MRPKTAAGLAVLLFLITFALSGNFLPRGPEDIDLSLRLLPPGEGGLLGTDSLGRDVLARASAGAAASLSIGLAVSLVSGTIGLAIGLACPASPVFDRAAMSLCDCLKAVPSTLLAMLAAAALGGGFATVAVTLSVANIPQAARLARSRTKATLAKPFIEAERALGIPEWKILAVAVRRHVAPSMLVNGAFVFSSAIAAEAALSFVGAGASPGQASWGLMLSEGKDVMFQAWWTVLVPAALLFAASLSLNLIADGLAEMDV